MVDRAEGDSSALQCLSFSALANTADDTGVYYRELQKLLDPYARPADIAKDPYPYTATDTGTSSYILI